MDLEKLYDEGRRLCLARKYDKALDHFKRIYEFDSNFRDVAEIVEDSYMMPENEWHEKLRISFRRQKTKPNGSEHEQPAR